MRALVYSALIVLFDQITKHLVRTNLDLNRPVEVLGNFFRLTFVENSGIVFGVGVGGALPVFTVLSAIATIFIIYFFFRERNGHPGVRISLALVLGGAIGNLIDRILFSRVVDFLDFGIGRYRFFVFNIADSAVTIGVCLFLIVTTFFLPKEQEAVVEDA